MEKKHHLEKNGIDAYIKAQDILIKRSDDVYLESHSIAINKNIDFVESSMELKIKDLELLLRWQNKINLRRRR